MAEINEKLTWSTLCAIFLFYNMSYKKPYNISKEYLHKKYIKNNKSVLQISRENEYSYTVIKKNLIKHGFRLRPISEIQTGIKKWENKEPPRGMLGKNHTKKTREKMRKNHAHLSGENCGAWKGGKTKLDKAIRNCTKYINWRKQTFERDNYTCMSCGDRNGNGKYVYLQVHHLTSVKIIIIKNNIKSLKDALLCGELWELSNGMTLCMKCHRKTESFLAKARKKSKDDTNGDQ